MSSKHAALAEREARILRHCRAGLALALGQPAYRDVVAARLAPYLFEQPVNLFQAQPWIWACALTVGPAPQGPLAGSILAAGALLRDFLPIDEPIESARQRWRDATRGSLDLDSTLRSHPFADLHAWLLRTPFAA